VLNRKLGGWLLGLPAAHDPFLPVRHGWAFVAFAIASTAYRWLVTLAIFWFLYRVLEPYGLKVLGQAAAILAVGSLVVAPVVSLVRWFLVPGRIRQVKKLRMASVALAGAAVLAGVMLIPAPHYVVGTLHLQPRDAASVYVDVPGRIHAISARPGESIAAGQPLLSLENVDLELALERLVGQRAQLLSQLANLQQRIFDDESAGLEMARVEEEIATVDEQIAKRRRDLARLTIVAPADGVVVPALSIAGDDPDQVRLATWSGTPLDRENCGATLADGVLVCRIGRPRDLEAILAIDQADVEFVQAGHPVEIFLEQQPGRSFASTIQNVAWIDMQHAPQGISSKRGGELLTTTDAAGRDRPLSATYEASAALDDPDGVLVVGGTGSAKIHVGFQTIGYRLWRAFCQTFEFEL
jgi:putative peptide zinc metalloprotease protein